MRPTRTKQEQLAIDALTSDLVSAGASVQADPTFSDCPDALLIVDGARVAVECRIFSPQALLRLHGYDWQLGDVDQIALPIEPHEWIRRSIDAKATRVETYRKRSDADEVWLLCHFGTWFPMFASEGSSEFIIEGVGAGIEKSNNKFDQIYIVDERAPEVACVFRRGLYQVPKELRANFPRGALPVSIFFCGKVQPEFGVDGKARVTANLQDPSKRILLQPLDTRFSLREEEVAALDFRNIGNGNPYPRLCLQPDEPFPG